MISNVDAYVKNIKFVKKIIIGMRVNVNVCAKNKFVSLINFGIKINVNVFAKNMNVSINKPGMIKDVNVCVCRMKCVLKIIFGVKDSANVYVI